MIMRRGRYVNSSKIFYFYFSLRMMIFSLLNERFREAIIALPHFLRQHRHTYTSNVEQTIPTHISKWQVEACSTSACSTFGDVDGDTRASFLIFCEGFDMVFTRVMTLCVEKDINSDKMRNDESVRSKLLIKSIF